MEVLLALLGAAEFVLCLWGSILCCATGGCCAPTPTAVVTVIYCITLSRVLVSKKQFVPITLQLSKAINW